MKFIRGKGLSYQLRYLSYIFKPHKLLIFFFTIIGAIVGGLGDAQAFFTDKNSLVPQKLTFLTNQSNARNIAIAIIVAPYFAIWFSSSRDTEEENQNISQITKKVTLPFVEEDLNKFLDSLRVKFSLSNSTRIYIMMPIRVNFRKWHLQIIINTQNYDSREKDIRLELNEGLIGYAFQGMSYDNRYALQNMDTDTSSLPASFINLTRNNKDLVRRDNKHYAVAPIFDQDFLSGVFIIDTKELSDLDKLKEPELSHEVFNWIRNKPKLWTLIWRVQNNEN